MKLNRNHKTIWYAFGRLFGLYDWVTFPIGGHEVGSGNLPNTFIEFPHKQMVVAITAIEESIKKMQYNELVNNTQALKCEEELLEIIEIINPEEMPSGNSPVSTDAQGMIQLGIYHEKSYLYGEKMSKEELNHIC